MYNFAAKKIDMTDPLEDYEHLNEYEKSILEQELLSRAFRNSYNLVTQRKTMNDIVQDTGGLIVAHDPEGDIKDDDLINMMDFFIEEEEYEKCAVIKKLIKKIKGEVIKKNDRGTEEFNKLFNIKNK